jgi:AcrR family transcriptional regulator
MGRRPYALKQRAESQEATRLRIVEAAMRLHETVGPKATTISAVAARAGVQRLTVYRHFSDEAALFQACTSHWLSLHPPPDPALWADIADPAARRRTALLALYRYYRGTQRMWRTAYRDEGEVAALHRPMREVRIYLGQLADGLMPPHGGERPAGRGLKTTLHHCVQFSTWASLAALGLTDDEAAELALSWIGGLA